MDLVDELAALPVAPEEIEQKIKSKLAGKIRAEIYDKDNNSLFEVEPASRAEYIARLKQMAVERKDLFFTLVKDHISLASIKEIIFDNELLSPQQKMQQFLFHMPPENPWDLGRDVFSLSLSKEILAEMVRAGFDVNAKIQRQEKALEPLLLSTLRSNEIATQALLEHGAKIPSEISRDKKSFIEKVRAGGEVDDFAEVEELKKSAYFTDAESEEKEDSDEEEEEVKKKTPKKRPKPKAAARLSSRRKKTR